MPGYLSRTHSGGTGYKLSTHGTLGKWSTIFGVGQKHCVFLFFRQLVRAVEQYGVMNDSIMV